MLDLKKIKSIASENLDMVFSNLGIEYEEFGDIWYARCPIHDDSDNPKGFSYSFKTNSWKCWTRSCNDEFKFDIFGLVSGVLTKQTGKLVSFGESVRWLSNVLNLDTKDVNLTTIIKESPDSFESLVKKFAKKEQEVELSKGEIWQSKVPSDYFLKRFFEPETLIEFGVGDCYDKLSKMKNRSIIPIHDESGSVIVGSICRAIYDFMEPKFLIDKDFEKRHYLYNHHRAKEAALRTSTLFIVEGHGDVWRLWEAGVKNAVGLFGKEISTQQESKINKMGITKLVVLLDHDQPGRESKIKIQRMFSRYYKIIFPKVKTRKDVGAMSPKEIQEKILYNLSGSY